MYRREIKQRPMVLFTPDVARPSSILFHRQAILSTLLMTGIIAIGPIPAFAKNDGGQRSNSMRMDSTSVPRECQDLDDAAATLEKGDLRVMSFNIRYGTANDGANHWDRRREFLVETIKDFAPDLLGTQETLDFQKRYLDRHLDGYKSIGVGRDNGDEKGEMTAIWFRSDRFEVIASGHLWLSETPEIPGSVSWDSSMTRMASWIKLRETQDAALSPILFINTHFDHIGKRAREESAKLLMEFIQAQGQGCAVLLTGDFNASDRERPYDIFFGEAQAKIEEADGDQTTIRLRDTYRVINPKRGDNEGTFSGFSAERTGGARIDWIGVSDAWLVIDAAIDRTSREGLTPSDHFPITAILRRSNPQ
ncbi:MAG TPA: endonuclease/exonuclease/phosphatase family protein [Pirellulaceae bacterium]|nr:endonuclease/exonuclease/phosphatase family protein [Pirellulaceae bacterium]HMO90897.1 endonuclease/exonuclease/phosphatase family protein [Pirellulaceae bacterium]HMP68627.1 endonuclease/exonuclease/phosphatase family protein [Pirellulaceae bacterium]